MTKWNLCAYSLFAGLLSISGCMRPDKSENDSAAPSVAAAVSASPSTLAPASTAGRTTGGRVNKFYVGHWEPVSNAWQGMGNLHIDGQSGFRWHQCNTTYVQAGTASSESAAVLALSSDSDCRLDDLPRTRVLFVHVANQPSPCDVRVTAYASAADMHDDRPSAAGIYARRPCGPTP